MLAAKQPPATRCNGRAACGYRIAAQATREHIGRQTVATDAPRITQKVARSFWTVSESNLAIMESAAPASVTAAPTSGLLQQQRQLSCGFAPLAS
jgi:hypothetical protein